MVDITRNLRGLILSASELKEMHPEWDEAMIEDYLNIFENIITLAGSIGEGVSKVVGGEEDNIVTLTSDGDIQDGGASIPDLIRRSYFYGRCY